MGITVEFHNDGCAVLTMRNGQNRWNLTTLKQFNDALDEVEKYVRIVAKVMSFACLNEMQG
jgi:hypothetical protein